ncbi:hypothetical protein GCM10010331_19250 [Streptomyces xanthochromogenes]|uniref:hypothetical protein n=1 Tax=Streptomyces xanthochromogenes TaxID=67384 RepID=UPI001672229B|nr:hypothetical protein [Streptomyces xanthochromogenes]GHB32538.1 hypothetical protein GCM10010331_19250 [Streptomyces xanthochromogenes]
MTRTNKTDKTGTKTRAGRPAAIGALGMATAALGLSSVTLAAAPASAKGAVEIAAPHTAQVGKAITVKAHGGDDSAGYLHQLCLEENGFGEGWHQETCSAAVKGDARVTAQGTSARSGTLRFRAVLYGLTGVHDQHPVRLHSSEVVTVRVR